MVTGSYIYIYIYIYVLYICAVPRRLSDQSGSVRTTYLQGNRGCFVSILCSCSEPNAKRLSTLNESLSFEVTDVEESLESTGLTGSVALALIDRSLAMGEEREDSRRGDGEPSVVMAGVA